ncbi:phage tail tape measure protein [Fodinicurvata sp. EGI_FJ10296]|uniref:phage tail tape measure protein n=1 Tax=Fodinicurvata sp. EGI_FJ10296 TaxID=3231908 RepID=UPI003456D988
MSSSRSRVQVIISAIDRLTAPLQRITRSIGRLSAPLRRIRSLASRIGRATGLQRIGRAADAAARRVRVLSDRLSEAGRRNREALSERHGQAMEAVGIGMALYGAMRPAVAFEDSIARVGAVANASGADMERLSESAREIGRVAPVGASDAADAMGYLGMAGMDTNEILAATPDLVNLSIAAGTDLARTADIASNILSGFNMSAGEMGTVADTMAATVTSANVDVAMLGDTMAYVAPAASSAGASLQEVAAMAGMLGDVGIQGSRAGTALNAVYSRLSSPVGEAADALADLGVEASDADGNLRAVPDILADLANQVDGMGSAELSATITRIFGREPAAAVQQLLNQSIDGSLSAYINELSDAEGAAQNLATRMDDTTGGALRRLSSAAESVAITVGELFLPALADLAEKLAVAANWVTDLAERYPTLTRWIGYTVGGLLALRVAMTAVSIATLVMKGGLIGAALGVTRMATGLALMLSPVGLVIGAVAALAAGAYLIYSNWDSVAAWFSGLWNWLSETVGGALSAITGFLWDWHPGAIVARAVNGIVESLFGIDMFALGREWIGALADGVSGAWNSFTDWLTGAITSLLDWMPDLVKDKLGIEVTATPLSDSEIERQAAETARRESAGNGPGPGNRGEYQAAFERERDRLRAENERIRREAANQLTLPDVPDIANDTAQRPGVDLDRFRVATPTTPTVAAYTPGSTAAAMPAIPMPTSPAVEAVSMPTVESAIDAGAAGPAMRELEGLGQSLTAMEDDNAGIQAQLRNLDDPETSLSGPTITQLAEAVEQPQPDVTVNISEGAIVIQVQNGNPESIRQAVDQGLRRSATDAARTARASFHD